jgi:hypothetical protein
MASYKPYFLIEDDQEMLRLFFNNSHLAPEKFIKNLTLPYD